MAGKTIVAASIQVDTGNSNANVLELNKNTNQLRGNLDSTTKAASGTGSAIDGTSGSFGKLKGQIGTLPGPLGQAQQGVQGLSAGFKALLANPVGLILAAIVAVLYTLYKAFANTFEGAQKIEQVFAGIKAAGQALIDNIENIGSAIKKVFSFNLSGAKKQMGGVAAAAVDAFNKMAALTKEAQKLAREQSQNDLDQIDRQAKLADLKEKAQDDSIPIKERIKLGKELLAASEENAKQDTDLAKRTAENKIAALNLEKDGERKNFEEINKIKGEQRRVEIESSNELRAIRKQVNKAEKEEATETQARLKEEAAARKDANDKYKQHLKEKNELAEKQRKHEAEVAAISAEARAQERRDIEAYGRQLLADQEKLDKAEAERIANNEATRLTNKKKAAELFALESPDDPAKKIALIQATLAVELNALAEGDIQRNILAKKASNGIIQIQTDETEAKKNLRRVEMENAIETSGRIGDAFGTLSDLVGRQTVAGKAFAIAQASITAIQGAINSFTSLSVIPIVGPALGAIAAAGAIAAGIANIKKITAVQIPGKGSGGSVPNIGITAAAAPLAPRATSTRIDQDQVNQIGNATVRAFVLDSDVANNQERNTRLNRAARLGGN